MISSAGILTIDLSAIQSNWCFVDSRLEKAECAAVVKADAYSVGAAEVASALYATGCRSFYLATLEEAIELRQLLPQNVTLYVLGGIRLDAEPEFVRFHLIPVLYSLLDIQRWLAFCLLVRLALPCAIKIDTGMTRLGLSDSELDKFIALIPNESWLNPILFMSHLACADEPDHPLNALQLTRFKAVVSKIKWYFPEVKASLANSSGTFLGEEYHFDMVRIGAALYGINPQPRNKNPLRPVINLSLPVLQIRTTETGVSVGYGAQGSVGPKTRLAVVAGGYADGVHRTLGLNPRGIVNGEEVRAVGRISMDSLIFDISAVNSNPAYIDVINHQITLDVLMQANKSLGYEMLTGLGRRYDRYYLPAKDYYDE